MPTGRTRDSDRAREAAERSTRRTIAASDVGVTLRISDQALKELDKIREETIKASQEDQKFSWR